jgi:excinuclease UvrABC helicase subunit UvrB
MNEAAIIAARRNKKAAGQEELFEASEKIILGPERKSRVISQKEKEMREAAKSLNFELAGILRDEIRELNKKKGEEEVVPAKIPLLKKNRPIK